MGETEAEESGLEGEQQEKGSVSLPASKMEGGSKPRSAGGLQQLEKGRRRVSQPCRYLDFHTVGLSSDS